MSTWPRSTSVTVLSKLMVIEPEPMFGASIFTVYQLAELRFLNSTSERLCSLPA